MITINTTHWRHILLGEAGLYWEAPFYMQGWESRLLAVLWLCWGPRDLSVWGCACRWLLSQLSPTGEGRQGFEFYRGKEETLTWTTSSWLRGRVKRFSEKSCLSQSRRQHLSVQHTLSMLNNITNKLPNINPVSHCVAQKQTMFLWYCSLLSMQRHFSEECIFNKSEACP